MLEEAHCHIAPPVALLTCLREGGSYPLKLALKACYALYQRFLRHPSCTGCRVSGSCLSALTAFGFEIAAGDPHERETVAADAALPLTLLDE